MGFSCECRLADCAYYKAGPKSGQCDCQHNDKHHYPKNPCPLYRKNWQNNDKAAEELKARMLKKR